MLAVAVEKHKFRVIEQLVQLTDRSFVRPPPKTAAGRRSITIGIRRSATRRRTCLTLNPR
jgi:hypothetical protein